MPLASMHADKRQLNGSLPNETTEFVYSHKGQAQGRIIHWQHETCFNNAAGRILLMDSREMFYYWSEYGKRTILSLLIPRYRSPSIYPLKIKCSSAT